MTVYFMGVTPISQGGEKRAFSCALEKKVESMFGISPLIPMANGQLMLMVSHADSTSLLTLTPSASQITAPEGTPGICVPVS